MKHEELTRTNEIQRLLQYFPEHTLIGQTHIPNGHQGLKWYGVAVLASIQVAEFLEKDVLMCAKYLNPQSRRRPAQKN
eukprot:1152000-Pelagomonas_calceolata.AAC.1